MSLGEDESTAETLGVLQHKGDRFTKLALVERKREQDLEEAIRFIMREADQYRDRAKKAAIEVMNIHVLTPNPAYQRADGVNIGKEAQVVTSKTLIVLEAKLNKLLQRKSEILNKIKKLKESINHYRLMRLQTDDAHKRNEDALAQTKALIEHTLAQSTQVVEERERLVEKKELLERLHVEEQAKFVEEYETMGRFVKEQNDALELALLQERKADNQHKAMANTAGRETPSKTAHEGNANTTVNTAHGALDGIAGVASDLTLDEEIEMAKKVGSLNSFLSTEQNSLSELRDKIASYESMFETLKKMTGVDSLEDMVGSYIAHEEEMFSLYNFIQTMNTEIDAVLEATAETESAIAKFKEDQQDQDLQRRSTIDELQTKLSAALDATSALVESNALQQECVSQVSKKVSSVFFKLQCDQMDAKGSQVGKGGGRWNTTSSASGAGRQDGKIAILTSQGVTESNVLDYLGCVEQRAVDVISEYLHVLSKDHALAASLASANAKLHATLTVGPRSPTPGPATPMHWPAGRAGDATGATVDLGDLADDEFLLGLDVTPRDAAAHSSPANNNNNNNSGNNNTSSAANAANTTSTSNAAAALAAGNNAAAVAGAADDSKPVDLAAFKAKLHKKLGMRESASASGLLLASSPAFSSKRK